MSKWMICSVAVCVMILPAFPVSTGMAAEEEIVVFPKSGNQIMMFRGEDYYLGLLFHGWGPKWSPYLGFYGDAQTDEKVLRVEGKVTIRTFGEE